MATIMFLGMSFCLPFAYIEEMRARRKQRSTADLERDAAAAPLLGDAYVSKSAMLALRAMSQHMHLDLSQTT